MADFVLMPQMGVSEESALLAKWLVKEGDAIKKEQPLFSLETGKSSFEELSKHEGVLLKIFIPEGEEVAVGAPVAVIGQPGEKFDMPAGAAAPAAEAPKAAEAAPAAEAPKAAAPAPKAEASADGHLAISPRARNLAAELGLDPSQASASGPEGRIIERDVKALAASGVSAKAEAAAPAPKAEAAAKAAAPAAEYEDKPISRIRKVIAQNMHDSLANMAQLTLNSSFDATQILAMRAEMKASEGWGLEKVTINDFILYAVARTLPEFPDLNANFINDKMRYYSHAQLGVAVDTPRGLMVPVLRNADKLSLREISEQVKAFAKQCRDGAVDPAVLSGGSFTVSNLGAFGVESFTPVINPPQTAILGVCNVQQKPRMGANGIELYPAMGLSLTFDHRVVDGAPAAKFLKALANNLEHINLLLAK